MDLIYIIHNFLQTAPTDKNLATLIFTLAIISFPIMLFIINPLIKKDSSKLFWVYISLITLSLIMSLIYKKEYHGFYTYGFTLIIAFGFIGVTGLSKLMWLKDNKSSVFYRLSKVLAK